MDFLQNICAWDYYIHHLFALWKLNIFELIVLLSTVLIVLRLLCVL